MKIAYLHGLESDPGGLKVEYLESQGYLVFAPAMNYKDPECFRATLNALLVFEPDIVIGSSMGGYFAFELATRLRCPALLFNPALHSRSFEPYVPTDDALDRNQIDCLIMLGRNDNVIPFRYTMDMICNSIEITESSELMIRGHGHQTPYDVFVEAVNYMVKRCDI
jgi:esterase/lipase